MSGPKDGRGRDAFDDFFGDPSPSGRMGAASERSRDGGVESTRDVGLNEGGGAAAVGSSPDPEPTQAATGAVPEEWWTSEPEPASPAGSGSSGSATPAPGSATGDPAPRRGMSPLALVAMLVGAVLVGGLCVGVTAMALSQEDEPVASPTTVTRTSSETSLEEGDSPAESDEEESDSPSSESDEEDSSTDSSTESTSESSSEEEPTSESSTESSSETSSSSSEPTSETSTESSSESSTSSTAMARSGEPPAGVTSCAGPSSGVSVGRGTDVTSCEFAVAVRNAYVAQDTDGAATLEVRSPVTDESYPMSCTGQGVTRCTGGNNAVVVLY